MDKVRLFDEKGKQIPTIDGFKTSSHMLLKNDGDESKERVNLFIKVKMKKIIEKSISYDHELDDVYILTRHSVNNSLQRKSQQLERPSKLIHSKQKITMEVFNT